MAPAASTVVHSSVTVMKRKRPCRPTWSTAPESAGIWTSPDSVMVESGVYWSYRDFAKARWRRAGTRATGPVTRCPNLGF